MNDPEILKQIAVIAVAFFGFASAALKLAYDYLIKKQETWPNLFKTIESIYNELDFAIKKSSCSRVLILKTENGGGVPKIGSKIYSSVVFERTKDKATSTKRLWQRQEVDSVYVKNMVRMIVSEQNYADIDVEDWHGSVIYDVYKSSGVKSSRLYEIARTKKTYYYLSFNFSEKSDSILGDDKVVMNAVASAIRRIFVKSKIDF